MLEDLNDENLISFLTGLIENPYMGIIMVDKEGVIRVINQTYLDLLDMKKEDVIGRHVVEVTPASRLPEVMQTGETILADFWPVNGHNTIVARMPIIVDGEIIGAIGKSLFLDVSGAKLLVSKLQQAEKELNIYKEEIREYHTAHWGFEDIVGENPRFIKSRLMAEQLSHTTSTVLICGESGTGKELIAHAIHNAGPRCNGPFVRVNCAALPENLLESELFGYEEGAFTGAKKGGKPGKFELANGGTIFLDEVGDMLLTIQTKLLTVLQERTIERVGGTRPIKIDVRIIAATNRDIDAMVANREFRADLYYRLNVVRINVPPLRERKEDIPLLASQLIKRINHRLNTFINEFTPEVQNLLINYDWPGNIRELENLLERAVNLADMNHERAITPRHFPTLLREASRQDLKAESDTLAEAVENLEREMIVRTLKQTGGNKSRTAKILGLHTSNLYRKLEKYGIS